MALEIERKFLVVGDYQSVATEQVRITQGYLSVDTGRTVRIRRWGNKGFITIKGASSDNGLSRLEWEKEISLEEVQLLLPLCLPGVIEKRAGSCRVVISSLKSISFTVTMLGWWSPK